MTKSPSAWDIYVRILSYFNNCSSHEIFSILLMEILHQLIGSLSNYLRFIHPRWCRISSINRINWWAVFTHQLGETHTINCCLYLKRNHHFKETMTLLKKTNSPEKSMDSKPPTACVFSLAVSDNPRNPISWSPDWCWQVEQGGRACHLKYVNTLVVSCVGYLQF